MALGEATLVIKDANDTALAHWSLPAVDRVNPGARPALYRPGPDAAEELEIDDELMNEAIRTVRRALSRAGPHPGRLRLAIFAASLAAAAGLAVLWLPGALARHTAAVLPASTRAELGGTLLAALEPFAGQPCGDAAGNRALRSLTTQALGPGWRAVVLPGGPAASAHLPGQIVLLHRAEVEAASGPAPLAALLAAEAQAARASDPMLPVLAAAGPPGALALLTRGSLPQGAIDRYAAEVLVAAAASAPPRAIEAAPAVTLADGDWLRLRQICFD